MPRSPIAAASQTAVAWRRLVARRPWVHWLLVAALAAATASEVADRIDDVTAARAAWGETREVLVATGDIAPGEPVIAAVQRAPAAVVPPGAVPTDGGATGLVARQHIGVGEIVARSDVVGDGELALVPPGWLAVPVSESPPSGARAGDRVQLVSEGIVLAPDAVVAGRHDDVTLIAVPADVAPAVPAAAAAGSLVVLREP